MSTLKCVGRDYNGVLCCGIPSTMEAKECEEQNGLQFMQTLPAECNDICSTRDSSTLIPPQCMNCTEMHAEVATGTVGVLYGGFPSFLRSSVAAHKHEQDLPYVRTVDYYSQLSALDDETKCNIFRLEPNGNNTDEESVLKSGRVVKSDVVVWR